jgi:hypothetical protein
MTKCPRGTNKVGNLCVSKPITRRDLHKKKFLQLFQNHAWNHLPPVKRNNHGPNRNNSAAPAVYLNSKEGAKICKAMGLRLPSVIEVYKLSKSRSKHVSFIKNGNCVGKSCLWQTTWGVRSGLWNYRTIKFITTRRFGDISSSADTGVFCVKKAK